MKTIVTNKILFDSNMYKDLYISEKKDCFKVKAVGSIASQYSMLSGLAMDRTKGKESILAGINDKSDIEQLEIIVDSFARNNDIHKVGYYKQHSGSNYLFFGNDTRNIYIDVDGKKYKKVLDKLKAKFKEDRVRLYGRGYNKYYLSSLLNGSACRRDDDVFVINLFEKINPEKAFTFPFGIDKKFLDLFLSEQIINKDGDVILEEGKLYSILTIGDTVIYYDDLYRYIIKKALKMRNIRIESEKRKQFKLDV